MRIFHIPSASYTPWWARRLHAGVGPRRVATPPMASTELRVGLRISARYQTNKIGFDTAWYSGSVLAVNSDGSCDIAYDDGEMERGILPEHVKVATHSFCSLKSTPIYGGGLGTGADGKKELSDDAKRLRASRGKGVGKSKRAGKAPAKRCETPSEGGSGGCGGSSSMDGGSSCHEAAAAAAAAATIAVARPAPGARDPNPNP